MGGEMSDKNSVHTPGPWRYQVETEIGPGGARPFKTYEVYTESGQFGHPATCEREEDARLVSAAPEMLAILKRISERYLLPVGAGPGPEIAALIAKAEGLS